ncbi:MAG: endonuclease [Limnoraphis sp. WC205]|nr:endonuclease [Limnoraphis sp. WC205]
MRTIAVAILLLILSFTTPAFADQTKIPNYNKAQNLFWGELYSKGGEDLYCGEKITPGDRSFNIEHVYPASWMKEAAGCEGVSRKKCRKASARFNRMEGDLHNLYPSLTYYNSKRSSYSFAIIPGNSTIQGCDFELNGKQESVEPQPISRGNIARSIFYMNKEYGAKIAPPGGDPELKDLLTAWHCADPVDEAEQVRNDRIEQLQGNRNPFIDNPDLISCSNIKQFPED